VGVDLDQVAVGIEDLDADKAAVVLPLVLGDARRPEARGARLRPGGLEARGVAGDEAFGVRRLEVPAGARAAGVADGVPA